MLPASVPRAADFAGFQSNPLAWLENSRRLQGDIVALLEDRPVFSRLGECAGCVALFGATNNRRVLANPDRFLMPVSVTKSNALPATLANLNTSLFSMNGERHRRNRRLVEKAVDDKWIAEQANLVIAGCAAFLESWRDGEVISLYGEMRRLALHMSGRVLFGTDQFIQLGRLIQEFFDCRRLFSSVDPKAQEYLKPILIDLGNRLDGLLRERIRCLRSNPGRSQHCLLSRMAAARDTDGGSLDEDELVAHSNILFTSASEPVAVTLTWALMLLSQFPAIRAALTDEIKRVFPAGNVADMSALQNLSLLDGVLRETLRLLPPNAIMVRATAGPVHIDGHLLPGQCEILLSPYVSHRNPLVFPDPSRFDPHRWRQTNPSPFEFFPFGAGPRHCLGKFLAIYLMKTALIHILLKHDLSLDHDQPIDWAMNINLIPTDEPLMRINPAYRPEAGGKIMGAVADLIRWY